MRTLSIPTTAHGRVLVEDAAVSSSERRGLIVAFHGYGQSADDVLDEVRRIPGASAWTIAAVQGLHRFYGRDNQRVIASWMTRQDRELAIADNVAYVDRAIAEVRRNREAVEPGEPLIFLGFSQGVAMAYRAALLGAHEPAGVIALAGDVPPELRTDNGAARAWPPVLLATGTRDMWFTPARLAEDAAFLEARGVAHESLVFDGGHEWTGDFRDAVARWLRRSQ